MPTLFVSLFKQPLHRCIGAVLLTVAWLPAGAADSNGAELRLAHCYGVCPVSPAPAQQLIARSLYSLSFNPQRRSAEWVAYSVTPRAAGIASGKSRQLLPEVAGLRTWVPEDLEQPEMAGYRLSRFAPLITFAGTPFWDEVNYGGNVIPLRSAVSQGAWYGLQWAIRNLVDRQGEVFVVTGPVFGQSQEGVMPPSALFKIVIAPPSTVAAFLLPQTATVSDHHCSMVSSVDEIEQLSRLDLGSIGNFAEEAWLIEALGC